MILVSEAILDNKRVQHCGVLLLCANDEDTHNAVLLFPMTDGTGGFGLGDMGSWKIKIKSVCLILISFSCLLSS